MARNTSPRPARVVALVLMLMFMVPAMTPFTNVSDVASGEPIKKVYAFSDGAKYKDITFTDKATDTTTAKLNFQKGITVANASVVVESFQSAGSYPSNISIDFGGDADTEWAWSGDGYGAMGHQDFFIIKDRSQNRSANLTISGGGGDNTSASIRLPYGAQVSSAVMEVEVKGVAIAIECKANSMSCDTANNDPVYSLQAVFQAQGWETDIVTGTDIDSADELGQYTVVVLGDSGHNDDDHATFQSALRTWIEEKGGGMVGLGWILFSTVAGSDMDTLLPVSGGYDWSTGAITITDPNHPVTQGVNGFNTPGGSHCEHPTNHAIDANAQTIGTCEGPTIVVADRGAGRVVYIGPNMFGNFQTYTSSQWYNDANAKLLVQQAALWASGGGSLSGFIDINDDGNKEWDKQDFNGTEKLSDFSAGLNSYLAANQPTYTDPYGNQFVDIPIKVNSTSAGLISLKNLSVTYQYATTVDINPHNGTLTEEVNGLIPDDISSTNVTVPIYVSSDTAGMVKLYSMNFDIQDPVHEPIITTYLPAIDKIEMDENTSVDFSVDAVDWYRYPITYTWTFDGKENGTGKTYKYYADFNAMGQHNVTVSASNGLAETLHWWTVVVKNVNRPPQILSYWPATPAKVDENTTMNFIVNATDPDKDPVGYTWTLDKVSVGVMMNTYLYKPDYRDQGLHTIVVTCKDPKSLTATLTWNVEVMNVNAAPELYSWTPKTDPTMPENTSMTFSFKARSPDDDLMSYEWYVDGTVQQFKVSTTFEYMTTFDDAGPHEVKAKVSDRELTDEHVWKVTVTDVNRDPVPKIKAPMDDDEFLTTDDIELDATGSSDPDADALTYEWYNGPTSIAKGKNATVKLPKGPHTLTLEVDDGREGRTSTNVIIIVRELKFRITIEQDMAEPRDGDRIKFKVTIESIGDADATDLPVVFTMDGKPLDNQTIDNIAAGDIQMLELEWGAKEGTHDLQVSIAQDKADRAVTVKPALIPGTGTGSNLMLPLLLILIIIICVIIAIAVALKRRKKAKEQAALQQSVAAPTAPAQPASTPQPAPSAGYYQYKQPVQPAPAPAPVVAPARPTPPPPQYAAQRPLPPPPPPSYYAQPQAPPVVVGTAVPLAPAPAAAASPPSVVQNELASTQAVLDAAIGEGKDVTRARNHLRLANFFAGKGDTNKALDYCRKARDSLR